MHYHHTRVHESLLAHWWAEGKELLWTYVVLLDLVQLDAVEAAEDVDALEVWGS